MKKRIPERPSSASFAESGVRYLQDDYFWINPFTGLREYDHSRRALDLGLLRREYDAEGWVPYEEYDLEGFVLQRLAAHVQQLKQGAETLVK